MSEGKKPPLFCQYITAWWQPGVQLMLLYLQGPVCSQRHNISHPLSVSAICPSDGLQHEGLHLPWFHDCVSLLYLIVFWRDFCAECSIFQSEEKRSLCWRQGGKVLEGAVSVGAKWKEPQQEIEYGTSSFTFLLSWLCCSLEKCKQLWEAHCCLTLQNNVWIVWSEKLSLAVWMETSGDGGGFLAILGPALLDHINKKSFRTCIDQSDLYSVCLQFQVFKTCSVSSAS